MNDNMLIWEAYENTPNSLMGFKRDGYTNKPFNQQNYKYIQAFRIIWANGDEIEDAVKGLNKQHAIERARRNWPDAEKIIPLDLNDIVDIELKNKLTKTKL